MRTALVLFLGTMTFYAAAQPATLEGAKLTVMLREDAARAMPFLIGMKPESYGTGGTRLEAHGEFDLPLTVGPKWDRMFGVVPAGTRAGTHTFTIRKADAAGEPPVLLKRNGDEVIDVQVGGEQVTAFHFSKDERKPYLWPLKGEGGASLTRDYPFMEGGKTKDHPHHVSFWTAHGDLNGADFWEYGERTGWQVAEKVGSSAGWAAGWIRAENTWTDKDRKPVVDEERTYIFYNTPANGRLIDVHVKFTATYGDVKFGDTKEGGIIGLRMNDDLREQGGTGKITTSEGAVGEKAAWGKAAAWCDYSGTLDDFGARGLTVMNHPTSSRYPIRWHVRAYGLLGANAFGYSDFTEGKENGEYTLKNGDTMSFFFRIYLHSGDAQGADVEGVFNDYVSPPVANWVE